MLLTKKQTKKQTNKEIARLQYPVQIIAACVSTHVKISSKLQDVGLLLIVQQLKSVAECFAAKEPLTRLYTFAGESADNVLLVGLHAESFHYVRTLRRHATQADLRSGQGEGHGHRGRHDKVSKAVITIIAIRLRHDYDTTIPRRIRLRRK